MTYDPERHHRRSHRWRGYDYRAAGTYYVTLCAQGRACLFGEVVDGELVQSEAGVVIECWWGNLERRFPGLMIDAYVVMPNHLHGIICLGADPNVPPTSTRVADGKGGHAGPPLRAVANPAGRDPRTVVGADRRVRPRSEPPPTDVGTAPTLGTVIQWFKTMSTNDYIRGVKTCGWPPFPGRLWQRDFYDHVIRNDADLERIRAYIAANPAAWSDDEENPDPIG